MTDRPVVVLATRNQGKIAELQAGLEAFGLQVLGLDAFPHIGEIEETGVTFEENAAIKAQAVCDATGLTAIADDSGLEVDALDGAPGVYSARYSATTDTPASTPRNNEKLLAELADVPEERRTARFRCVMAVAAPGGATLTTDGAWEGRIALEPDGDNGFGYDPLFFDPEAGQTSATMTREKKNSRSHRGKALAALLEAWPAFWEKAGKQG